MTDQRREPCKTHDTILICPLANHTWWVGRTGDRGDGKNRNWCCFPNRPEAIDYFLILKGETK